MGTFPGHLALTPNGVPPEADLTLSGTIDVINEEGTDRYNVLFIVGGDYVLDGVIVADDDGLSSAGVELSGSASLSGGSLDIKGYNFWQEGDSTIGESASVRNLGRYAFETGDIGAGGLENLGLMFMTNRPGSRRIARLSNMGPGENDMGVVRQSSTVQISPPGITNAGLWRVDNSTIELVDPFGGGRFLNTGTFRSENGLTVVAVEFDNQGIVIVDASTLQFTDTVVQYDRATRTLTGGTWELRNDGSLSFDDSGGPHVVTVAPGAEVRFDSSFEDGFGLWGAIESVQGATFVRGGSILDVTGNDDNGDLEVDAGGDFRDGEAILAPGAPARTIANVITNRGRVTVYNTGVIQANTALDLLDGGILTGDLGNVETPIVNNVSGVIEPGFPAGFEEFRPVVDTTGQLTIDGDYDQQPGGALTIEVAGTASGDFDRLVITGDATLDGTLVIEAIDGYEPRPDDTFEFLTAASITASFATVIAPAEVEVSYLADRVVVTFMGPACEGDIDMSGDVGLSDLLLVLSAWGSCELCPEDLNDDGVVDLGDLLTVLASWGGCQE